MSIFGSIFGGVVKKGLDIVDQFVEDKDKANQLKHELTLRMLAVTKNDPLCTRQGIAWTFHLFMWGNKLLTGSFPQDVIFKVGNTEVTIGIIYLLIIAFYFPFRAFEKIAKGWLSA